MPQLFPLGVVRIAELTKKGLQPGARARCVCRARLSRSAAVHRIVRRSSYAQPMKTVLAPLCALSVLLFSAPGLANADPDSDFLNTLSEHHITYSSQAHIIHIGTTLCQELRNSMLPPDQAVQRIQGMGYTDSQANVIAAAAVLAFCPDMDRDGV